MTKDGSFKKVVRRHAEQTGQRYTEAKSELEGLEERMVHQPDGEKLVVHLRDHYGIDATAATQLSVHNTYVFRIDRRDGDPWIARAFPPARPRVGVEGDAEILRFLERQDFPAERLAVDDAVSDFGDSNVLVTTFVSDRQLPDGSVKIGIMGDLLGRLHSLPLDDSVSRPGGAQGLDPAHEGGPRQDLLAGLAMLDAVDTKVAPADRDAFEQLRERVRNADAGEGLPEALIHGNMLHAPDHALMTDDGAVGINWMASGRGPRLFDFAWLLWGCWIDDDVTAGVEGYRKHVELTDEELDRLEDVMFVRPLYLTCFGYRRNHVKGWNEDVFAFSAPEHIVAVAAAARKALGR
jgi:Ser/Thr protein kinase RdoA (MazF antagonist)